MNLVLYRSTGGTFVPSRICILHILVLRAQYQLHSISSEAISYNLGPLVLVDVSSIWDGLLWGVMGLFGSPHFVWSASVKALCTCVACLFVLVSFIACWSLVRHWELRTSTWNKKKLTVYYIKIHIMYIYQSIRYWLMFTNILYFMFLRSLMRSNYFSIPTW